MRQLKIIIEKHPEGYVAYPLGLKGVVVGEGDTYLRGGTGGCEISYPVSHGNLRDGDF